MSSSFRSLPAAVAAITAVTLWSTNAFAADLALGQMGLGWLLLTQFSTASVALLVVRTLRRARLRAGDNGGVDRLRSTVGEKSRRPDRGARTGAERTVPRGAHGPPDRGAILLGVVGLTGTMVLQYVAFALAPIVAANVLSYAWPLLAAGWLAATLRSKRALVSAGLALLGFVGIGLIFSAPDQNAGEAAVGGAVSWGYIAALGSAACMAVYTLGASRRPAGTATSLLLPATLVGTAAAAALTIASAAQPPTGSGVLAAVYLGLGPMAAGYTLWTRAMSGGGAERLSPLGYATPLLSTVLLVATGASATSSTFLGIGLVLICSLGVLAHDRFGRAQPVGRREVERVQPAESP